MSPPGETPLHALLLPVPVVLDGVGVMPGHYVYADSAGAVVIPADEVWNVLEEAARIERQDSVYLDEIKAEHPHRIGEGTPRRRPPA